MLEEHCTAAKVVVSTRGEDGCDAVARKGNDLDIGALDMSEDWPKMTARHGTMRDIDTVITCASYALDGEQIVDTTGAGDAFIAGVCFGLATKQPLTHCLALGRRVAWHKLQGIGARSALPRASELGTLLGEP